MPKTPPRSVPPVKTKTSAVDTRQHPIPGASYRVRDKDYKEIWGENLSWDDAVALKHAVVNSRKSTTARIEAEDIQPAPHLVTAANEARRRLRGSSYIADPGPIVTSPPLRMSKGTTSPPMAAQQLTVMQGVAMNAAAGAAAEAQKRADEKAAAAARKAERDADLRKANEETARLAREADELAGGDDTPEGDIDDLLSGGAGAVPTDEEIRKAKNAQP